jgi:hypothetical protein
MTRINIPASIEDATERLTGIESLLTAQRWERAAIVAAFVRLSGSGGDRRSAGRSNENGDVWSAADFASLGVAGLRSEPTVRTYVNRWLEHSQGVYPEPGAAVELPDAEWEGTRTGTNGHSSTEGMQDTIRQMTETHGAAAVAEAISASAPDVAAQVRPPRTIVDDVRDNAQDFADEMRDRSRQSATGATSAAAQEVILAAQRVAGARMTADLDGDRSVELITAVNHLRSFLDSWHGFLTGECSDWTANDLAFAAELGIQLEVHS